MKKKINIGFKSIILLFCLSFAFLQGLSASNSYGLATSIQEGVILHCFDWKYSDIKAELPNIAAAGFTSVQTSPAQVGIQTSGAWYWIYQPTAFAIGSNGLGTKDDLVSLCTEAHKYGIKVVVDVVANHMASESNMPGSDYWHTYTGSIDYSNRWQITHGSIGMPDLNSENTTVQSKVSSYIDELIAAGVDGIRWDAAKHIGLPTEGCNFWPAVTGKTAASGDALWNYGEILDNPVSSGGEDLMKEYTTYMSVTDSPYGTQISNAFSGGSVPTTIGNWCAKGISNNKIVYWAESHDTYSNDGGQSKNISQNAIDRAYAIAASHNDVTALYFSRPSATDKNSILLGEKGSTHFTSKEVAAVNHFHNALIGQADYYSTSNGVASSCRKGGAIIVKGSGSGSVTAVNGGGYTTAGTYTDEVSGNQFTVTSTTITGTVGESGIAVIYNSNLQGYSVDKASGTYYQTVTTTITPSGTGTKLVYTTDGSTPTSSSTQITSATSLTFTANTTLKVGVLGSDNTVSSVGTYTYKISQTKATTITVYVKADQTPMYIYEWTGTNTALSAAWPGTALSSTKTIGGVKWYYFTVTKASDDYSINFILNQGGDATKSADITGITSDVFYSLSSNTATDLTSQYIDYLDTSSSDVSMDKEEGSYEKSVTVTMTASDASAVIAYTTDGSTPTASSAQATGSKSLTFTSTTTLKAGILKSGTVSSVVSKTYTITAESTKDHAYFIAPAAWTKVCCWAWDTNNNKYNFTGGTWPGVACTTVGTSSDGLKIWEWISTDTSGKTPTNIIFNNGSGDNVTKTADLVYTKGGYYNINGATTGISSISADTQNGIYKVYTIDGKLLRKTDSMSNAVNGLNRGIYIINNKKYIVE